MRALITAVGFVEMDGKLHRAGAAGVGAGITTSMPSTGSSRLIFPPATRPYPKRDW